MTRVFVAWTRYDRRADVLARRLGAELHLIHPDRPMPAPLRYPGHMRETLQLLRRIQPETVIVQNPPIFCALAAWLYVRRHGGQYAIDSHTGSFVSAKWRWSLGLHRWLSRRAQVTIAHNQVQEQVVRGWGCPVLRLSYTPFGEQASGHYPLSGDFNVAVVCSMAPDEPFKAIFAGAEQLPRVRFFVTGNPKRMPPAVRALAPDNCVLTGYLPARDYGALLASADAVMALTTRSHSMLMGAFEGISLGKPLIVSDSPVLRDCFPRGAVLVDNTASGIAAGVRRAQCTLLELEREAVAMRSELEQDWERQSAILDALLAGNKRAAQ